LAATSCQEEATSTRQACHSYVENEDVCNLGRRSDRLIASIAAGAVLAIMIAALFPWLTSAAFAIPAVLVADACAVWTYALIRALLLARRLHLAGPPIPVARLLRRL
jgi:hypothetical protein